MHKETVDALIDASNGKLSVRKGVGGGYDSKGYALTGQFGVFCEAVSVATLNLDGGDVEFSVEDFMEDCKNMICECDSKGNWIFQ